MAMLSGRPTYFSDSPSPKCFTHSPENKIHVHSVSEYKGGKCGGCDVMYDVHNFCHLTLFSEEEKQEVKIPLFTTAEIFDSQISCRKSQRRGLNS
jgi:hypothetical protein